jgi:macrophage erythroblast attacher
VCDEKGLGVLAREIPSSQHLNSKLVCALSGITMDDNNPPMAFKNGYVYSRKVCFILFAGFDALTADHISPRLYQALEEMASRNDGYIICPRSGQKMQFTELRKVFVT